MGHHELAIFYNATMMPVVYTRSGVYNIVQYARMYRNAEGIQRALQTAQILSRQDILRACSAHLYMASNHCEALSLLVQLLAAAAVLSSALGIVHQGFGLEHIHLSRADAGLCAAKSFVHRCRSGSPGGFVQGAEGNVARGHLVCTRRH